MFIKQVDEKTALELAEKGKEVLILVPGGKDSGWEGMMPDTLRNVLDGCMFFRKEPAMEIDQMVGQTIEFGPAEPEEIQTLSPTGKKLRDEIEKGGVE